MKAGTTDPNTIQGLNQQGIQPLMYTQHQRVGAFTETAFVFS